MRDTMKILLKLAFLSFFLFEIVFKSLLTSFMTNYDNSVMYKSVLDFNEVMEDFVNGQIDGSYLVYNSIKDIDSYTNVDVIDVDIPPVDENKYEPISVNKDPIGDIKKVYIYSTHQMEEYLDGYYVVDGAEYLATKLREYGIEVDVEKNDFVAYGKPLGLGYKELYTCSRHFAIEALGKKEYDLVIDFHRDALERELTYLTYDNKDYAKVMIVVGTINEHFDDNYQFAKTLYDKISEADAPIIKNVYKPYARYNQDLSNRSLLIEFGSQNNYFSEIKRSIDIVAHAIATLRE